MKKKILATALVVVIAISMLFAGCGTTTATSSATTTSTPAGTATPSTPAITSETPAVSQPATSAPETSATTAPAAASWKLAIEGVTGVTEFTSEQAAVLNAVTIEMTVTNKAGEAKTSQYTGVLLKDLLKAIGAESATAITVEAADGFSTQYDAKLINADDTLVSWAKDGEVAAENPITIAPKQGTGNQFAKQVVKIIITK